MSEGAEFFPFHCVVMIKLKKKKKKEHHFFKKVLAAYGHKPKHTTFVLSPLRLLSF